MKIKEIEISKLKELKEKSKMLNDERQKGKVIYKIWDIVVVVILAVLADCNEWEEIADYARDEKDFLKKFLKLTGGIPTAKTYERVISLIDSQELNKIFVDFINDIKFMDDIYFKDILSFDGKVDKGSSRKKGYIVEDTKPLNVLNVYSDRLQMCIEQEIIEEKTNEITAIPEVIKRLDLTNVICTWDALNTQKDNVKAVISKGGDYCVALKGNQGNFYKDVQDYFDEDRLLIIQSGYEGGYQLTREKNHKAVITYEYYQTEKVNWYEDIKLWEGLKSIGLVKKTIEKSDGTKVEEKRYYISSLLLDISVFSNAIRKHWNVENKLHWQMDFTFKSDDNTTMNKKALFNLQIIKKFCLTILNEVKKEKNKSLKRIRKDISRNVEKETIEIFKILRNFDTSIISKSR
jgi:predicted transposase YbfD/YdcC